MKKFLKKLFVFVAIIPMLFVFAACKKDDDSTTNNAGTEQNPPIVVTDSYNVSLDYNLPEKYKSFKANDVINMNVGTAYTLPLLNGTAFEGLIDYYTYENGEKIETLTISGTKDQNVKIKAVWKKDLSLYLKSTGLDFEYDNSNNTATLKTSSSSNESILIIPTYVENNGKTYVVNRIKENAFNGNQNYKTVLTYANYLFVENKAFYNSNVENFDFKIVSNLGNESFAKTNVKSAEFSSLLSSLGTAVFAGCQNLTSVDFTKVSINTLNAIPEQMFLNCSKLETVKPSSNMTTIKTEAFKNCSSLVDLSFLETYNINTLENNVFENATINSVKISENLTSLGTDLFKGAFINELHLELLPYDEYNSQLFTEIFGNLKSSLKKLKISGDLSEIYSNYFKNFVALESLDLSGCTNLTKIGQYAFYGCEKLETISFGEELDASVFNVTAFYNTAWYNNFNDMLIIGKTLVFAPTTYSGNSGVVQVGTSVETIADAAFTNNKNITTINIPATVKSIGKNAFSGCSGLVSVNFETGSNLENIDNSAFSMCLKLSQINLENCTKLATIGESAFWKIGAVESFVIPDSVSQIKSNAFGISSIKNFADNSNQKYKVIDGALYELDADKNPVALVCYPTVVTNSIVNVPATVTKIYDYAFLKNLNIDYVRILADNVDIDDYAFDSIDSLNVKVLSNAQISTTKFYLTIYFMLDESDYDFDGSDFVINSIPNQTYFNYFAVVEEDIYLVIVSVSGETITVESAEKITD